MSGEDVRAERLQALVDRLVAGTLAPQLLAEGAEPELVQLASLAAQAEQVLPARAPSAFRARLQAELQAELHTRHRRSSRGVPWGRWVPRLAAGLLAVALLWGSAVVASAASLPGEPLYGVKRAAEQVRLTFAWNHEARAAVQMDIAEARLDEIRSLRAQGMAPSVGLGADLDAAHQAALEEARAAADPSLVVAVEERIGRHQSELEAGADATTPPVAGGGQQAGNDVPSATPRPTMALATATPPPLPGVLATPTSGRPVLAPPTLPATPVLAVATSPPPTEEPDRPASTAVSPPTAVTEPTEAAPAGVATLNPGEARAATRAADATREAAATATPRPTATPRWPWPRPTRRHRDEPSPPPPGPGGARPTGAPSPTAGP